jgi:hypothetical protein
MKIPTNDLSNNSDDRTIPLTDELLSNLLMYSESLSDEKFTKAAVTKIFSLEQKRLLILAAFAMLGFAGFMHFIEPALLSQIAVSNMVSFLTDFPIINASSLMILTLLAVSAWIIGKETDVI